MCKPAAKKGHLPLNTSHSARIEEEEENRELEVEEKKKKQEEKDDKGN